MRVGPFHWLIVAVVCVSCSEELSPNQAELDKVATGIFGIDFGEKVLLYNGSDVNPGQEQLLIDGDAIVFDGLTDKANIGKQYSTQWRNSSYSFYRIEFPIINIQTRNGQSVGEEYNSSQFDLIDSGRVVLSGNLGIRLRGNTSLTFPKKSYRLEIWEDTKGADNRSVSLLGMRRDDDWLLDGMWNEPLAIRDKSAMELWLSFGRVHYQQQEPDLQLGADRRYCELFINQEYYGLYYIGEQLDRKQLKLETKSGSAGGGELYKAKGWGDAVGGFRLPEIDNSSLFWGNYEVKYPTDPGTYDWAKLKALKTFILKEGTDDFDNEYSERIDVDNIVDYFIFTNLLYAFDNQGNNVFIARRDQTSPYFFVSWDFDATLGLGIFGEEVPVSDNVELHILTKRLLQTIGFRNSLKERWAFLRSGHLQTEKIKAFYRNNYATLLRNNVYEREGVISRLERSIPNASSMLYLERIIDQRLLFLDEYMGGL
jgi:hypothetical protein